MNPHNWNLAKFPNHKNMVRYVEYHGLVLMGIFNRTLYNKLIVQSTFKNPRKRQMKWVQVGGQKWPKNKELGLQQDHN